MTILVKLTEQQTTLLKANIFFLHNIYLSHGIPLLQTNIRPEGL